jgi:hypothetical protein
MTGNETLLLGIVAAILSAFGIAFAFKMAYLEHHDRLGRRFGFDVKLICQADRRSKD